MLRCCVFLLFFTLSPPFLTAETLSWEAVLAEAGRANLDLLNVQEDLRQAELAVRVARAAFLPSASASAGLSQGGDYQADGVPGRFGDGSNGSSARLSASWDLFSGFGDLAALSSAKAQQRAALAQARETKARLGFELRSAFLTLLQAQEREAQAQGIAQRRADNVELVQLRFEAGREHKGALLQTQAQAAQAAAQARRAERERGRASLSLARLLGREPQAALRAAGELQSPALPTQGPPQDLEGLPAMQRAQATLESAEQDLRRSRATWWPSLGASASVGRSGGDWLSENGSWSAGLSLSLPLFQGGSRLASTQAAASRLEEAGRVLIQSQRQLRLDLEQSYGSLADAVDSAEVQALFLEAGLLRAEVAQAQYTQGLLGFEAWDQVESDLINAQVQALSSRGDAQRALAAWERSLGRDLWP